MTSHYFDYLNLVLCITNYTIITGVFFLLSVFILLPSLFKIMCQKLNNTRTPSESAFFFFLTWRPASWRFSSSFVAGVSYSLGLKHISPPDTFLYCSPESGLLFYKLQLLLVLVYSVILLEKPPQTTSKKNIWGR